MCNLDIERTQLIGSFLSVTHTSPLKKFSNHLLAYWSPKVLYPKNSSKVFILMFTMPAGGNSIEMHCQNLISLCNNTCFNLQSNSKNVLAAVQYNKN